MAGKIDETQVRHVAELARLRLDDDEVARFGRQLGVVLEYMDRLNELETDDVSPTAHPLPIRNVFRDDLPAEPLGADKVLAGAPAEEASYFTVPKVLDQDPT